MNVLEKPIRKGTFLSRVTCGEAIKLIYVVLFCGGGGESTGIVKAMINGERCAVVVGCVNHEANAIASHAANHIETEHFTEDIRQMKLNRLMMVVEASRVKFPNAKVVLQASLECTNHSKAKGGMSRDADSRTLAEYLYRYIIAIDPDFIHIENVEEFLDWGPLMIKEKVNEHGFKYCLLDYKKNKDTKKTDILPVYVPDPKYKGKYYDRWVCETKKYGYEYDFRILNSANFGAYTSRKRLFIQFSKTGFPIVWAKETHAKNPEKLGGDLKPWNPVRYKLDLTDEGKSIFSRDKPLVGKTISRINDGCVKFIDAEEVKFISSYYGNGGNRSINEPSATITTKDRFSYVSVHFLDMQYGNGHSASIDMPAGTITTNPKHNLVSVRKSHFLMNPQYSSKGGSIDDPCFTLIARMDKQPPYLITADRDITNPLPFFIRIEGNKIIYEIYESDSQEVKKLKEFMALHGIVDIKMRMLKIPELKGIMGFPEDYVLVGTKAEQKKYIGNAVEVTTSMVQCEALAAKLIEMEEVA